MGRGWICLSSILNEDAVRISKKDWKEYISGVYRDVQDVDWLWEAATFDTKLKGASLYNDHTSYYIESLGRYAKGYEINYIGQGMLYRHLTDFGWLCHVLPYGWKAAGWVADKVTFHRAFQNRYHLPTANEKFFVKYGWEAYRWEQTTPRWLINRRRAKSP